MFVVLGNQLMYFLCSQIADWVGFRDHGQREAHYIRLYTTAVTVNILVDIVIVAITSYLSMLARGVADGDGTKLADLTDVYAIFNFYPMQITLSNTLYSYSFPSTFLVPFVMEAFMVGLVFHSIMFQIVGRHKVPRSEAENCLNPFPMDLSRYADLVVNVILVTLSLVLSTGLILQTLIGFMIGSAFIYFYDHWRVLRNVQSFYFSSGSMDKVAMKVMIIPCALLLVSSLFQAERLGYLNISCRTCLLLGVGHFFIHERVLSTCIKIWRVREDYVENSTPYETCARRQPSNWFNTNPVHCLRSKHLHGDFPACVYCVKGKEFLLQKNEQIGLFFEAENPAGNSIELTTFSTTLSPKSDSSFIDNQM